jgi:hypothetical protein
MSEESKNAAETGSELPVNYVYGFSTRRGQKCPTHTVAVVPFVDDDGDLFYGVGLSVCGEEDFPCKATGRRIAEARARAVLASPNDIHAKPYYYGDNAGRLLGIRCHWENAPLDLDEFDFKNTFKSRIENTFKFLARKHNPEITE